MLMESNNRIGRAVRGVLFLAFALTIAAWLAACDAPSPETPAAALLAAEPATAPGADAGPADASAEEPVAVTQEVPADDLTSTDAGTPDVAEAAPAAPLRPSEVLDSFSVEANYAVTSTLADGSQRVQQVAAQGSWMRTASPWGYDASYRLVNTTDGSVEELAVTLVGDSAAVWVDGDWTSSPRRADMPFGDPHALLDTPLMTRLQMGEALGEETIAGVPAVHYRIDAPEQFVALMGDALATGDGSVESVLLDGWLAADGYVVQYVLDAVYRGVTTVDADGQAVQADQAFALRYALGDLNVLPPIAWPAEAPAPGTIDVPGFAPGEFPLPENAVVLPSLGMLEIIAEQPAGEVEAFYASRLAESGWALAEEYGLYTATKDDLLFEYLVTADEASGGSKVEIYLVDE